MGCGGNRTAAPQLVQIRSTTRRSVPIERRKTAAEASIADFYCDDCGLTRFDANQPFRHHCDPSQRRITFVDHRRAICGICEQNNGGICQVLKKADPSKDASIPIGVEMFTARCPLNYWLAVRVECPECGKINRSLAGIDSCEYCSWTGDGLEDVTQSPIESVIAVTSLSPSANHRQSQQRSLASWKAFGLQVHAVNTPGEIHRLRELYPAVDAWHPSSDIATSFSRQTQKINSLADVATRLDRTVMVINSDIEIHGPQSRLTRNLANRKSLIAGIRYNFESNWRESVMEKWGFDAFVFTPEMAASLPRLDFSIGRPIWDYWIPYHFRNLGYTMDFIGKPLFFHRNHQLNWSKEEWSVGTRIMHQAYGPNSMDFPARKFRNSLPFPPDKPHEVTPRVLFHHIPKTAGSTVTHWLKKNFSPNQRWETDYRDIQGSVREFRAMRPSQRRMKRLVTGHGTVDCLSACAPGTVAATVLRHPVERLVSFYYFEKAKGETNLLLVDFVRTCQNRFAYSDLGGAKGILDAFHVIGFQHNIDGFCRQLADRAGLRHAYDGERKNVTVNRLAIDEIPKSDLAEIAAILRPEIEIYNQLAETLGESHHG